MLNNKLKVCVIYGGPSTEHDVSVRSGKNVFGILKSHVNYSVLEVYLHKNMIFEILYKDIDTTDQEKKTKSFSELDFFKYLKIEKVDYVFPILHGEYGEDGQIQKKLEKIDIKYFGSNSIASHNAMDKNIANNIFENNKILIPKSKIIDIDSVQDLIDYNFKFPIILKPVSGGSSLGLFKFENEPDLKKSLVVIFGFNKNMIAQEFISGREFTCGVVEYKNIIQALPVTEVLLSKTELFDYEAKYTIGACSEITPADISLELSSRIQNLAIKCHKVLGCKDISRTDIILDEKRQELYVLETNSLPGMTETSFIPAQLKAANINLKSFLESKFI